MPAGDGVLFEDIDYVLKTVYAPKIVDYVMKTCVLWGELDEYGQTLEGEKLTGPVEFAQSQATDYRADDASLPIPDKPSGTKWEITPTQLYHTIRLTVPAVKRSRKNKAAFVKILAREMKQARNAFRRKFGSSLYGNANNVVARVDSYDAPSKTVTLKDCDLALDGNGDYFGTGKGAARRCKENDKVGFGDDAEWSAAGSPDVTFGKILSVNRADGEITLVADPTNFAGAENPAADDLVMLGADGGTGLAYDNGYGEGINGLIDACGTGTFEAIDPASHPLWEVWEQTGETPGKKDPFTEEDWMQFASNHDEEVGDEDDFFICHGSLLIEAFKLWQGRFRTLNAGGKIKGGYKGYMVMTPEGELKLISDSFATYNTMYGINKSHMFRGTVEDMGWDDVGGILKYDPSNRHAMYGIFYWIGNLVYTSRRHIAIWRDLRASGWRG